jgi:transposase
VWRARIVLATAEGCGTAEIMRRAGVSKPCVWRWQERFMREGVLGLLHDKSRKPGKAPLPSTTVERVVGLTLGEPPGEATRWTGQAMAKAAGISLRSVQRIWAAHRLAPHRVRTVKLSRDPAFIHKLRDVVGLYMHPPAQAIVLSIDEKSQIQALDRTQRALPMKKGQPATATHDYERHGTTILSAALNVLDGTVLGRCMQRHRHQELLRFLNAVEVAVPAGKLVHAILDNYAAHKDPKVMAWLARHPRWTFHFTPTSCSWLNAVETFFAKLTNRRLRRGTFPSLVTLQEAINRFVEEHSRDPRPLIWTADPEAIVEKVRRGYHVLASMDRRAGYVPRGRHDERGGRVRQRSAEGDDDFMNRPAARRHPDSRRGRLQPTHG